MSPESGPQMDRRKFLAMAGAGIITVGIVYATNRGDTPQIDPVPGDPTPESLKPNLDFDPVFADQAATAEVQKLGINSGDYFRITETAVKNINTSGCFASESKLLPIFPPEVTKHAGIIEKAAQQNNIPPNVLATLATIESAGNTSIRSGADAYGLVQVVPKYHLERFIKHGFLPPEASYSDYQKAKAGTDNNSRVSWETYKAALTNPEASVQVGAEYYGECVANARKKNPALSPNDMRIFAIAAASYNGGPGLAGQEFKNYPTESKLYVNHMSRFVLDIEVAALLRANGKGDEDILKAMQSKEIEARAYSYGKFKFGSYDSYENRAELFTHPIPGVDPAIGHPANEEQKQAQNNWEVYKNGHATIPNGRDNRYVIPAPPALRIWLAGGGMGMFGDLPDNACWRLPN